MNKIEEFLLSMKKSTKCFPQSNKYNFKTKQLNNFFTRLLDLLKYSEEKAKTELLEYYFHKFE